MVIDAEELKRRYLLRIAGLRDDKVYIGPESVTLELANACNLRCKFCITGHSPGNPEHFDKANFLPWEKFLGIVRDCVDLNVDRIDLAGLGEPTIHPSFREMMRHLEQHPVHVKLFTNATFPLDYCEDVIRGDHVVINLSAADRQQFIDLKGKDLFDRVVGNIERLVALRDARKPGFYIEIIYVVNKMNIAQKQKMKELADRLGVNSLYFRRMNVHAYNQDIALPDSPMEETVSRTLKGVGSFASKLNRIATKYFELPDGIVSEPEEKDPYEGVWKAPPVCSNGWFSMLVVIDGNFSVCFRIPHMRSMDLEKWSLKEFWLSSQMMDVRLLGKHGHIQKMFKACQTCPFYEKNIQRAQSLERATL